MPGEATPTKILIICGKKLLECILKIRLLSFKIDIYMIKLVGTQKPSIK